MSPLIGRVSAAKLMCIYRGDLALSLTSLLVFFGLPRRYPTVNRLGARYGSTARTIAAPGNFTVMSGHGTLSTDDLSHQAERLSLAPDVHPDSLRSKDDPRTSQQLSEYRYEPLDSDSNIRILILQPALDISSPLITNLVQVRRRYNSGDRPLPILQDYVAISYHWGPPHFVCAITCDGRSLAVTPNVDHMLRRLRKVDRPRGLWIDAICLYQANKVEKSVQIQQMRQIYEEAKKVIIWLGEPSAFVGDLKAHQSLADLEAEATGTALNVIASLRYLKATGSAG